MNVMKQISANEMMSCGFRLIQDMNKKFPSTQTFFVGGCVRDIVMNKTPHDVDISTNVDIHLIEKLYKTKEIGQSKDFGIVLVLFEGYDFEIAHFRSEIGSADNRHPDKVELIKDFYTDTSRRDLTINTLGIDVNGDIIDFHGGVFDIKSGIIKAVGNPEDRFDEDALRIIRCARFASTLNFQIDDATLSAMRYKRRLICNLSIERVRDELIKSSKSGESLVRFLEIINDIDMLDHYIPEINKLRSLQQQVNHHPEGNVFQHTMSALKNSLSDDPITNLSILFHDIGKITTQVIDGDRIYFHGHENAGIEIFQNISKRLRMSKEQTQAIEFGIKYHMQFHKIDEMKKKKIIAIRQNKYFELLKNVSYADEASRIGLFDKEAFDHKVRIIEHIFQIFGEKQVFEARMSHLINGRMIIDVAHGINMNVLSKTIGVIKKTIRAYIIDKEFDVTKTEVYEMIVELSIKFQAIKFPEK